MKLRGDRYPAIRFSYQSDFALPRASRDIMRHYRAKLQRATSRVYRPSESSVRAYAI